MSDEEPIDRDLTGIPAEIVISASVRIRHRRRRSRQRSATIALKSLTQAEIKIGRKMYPPIDDVRPTTRGECRDQSRPCPYVACKHHLYLDINPETGSIKINFPDLEPWELKHTCSLDVADAGGVTLEEVGTIMNLTRERVRQIEVKGLMALKQLSPEAKGHHDYIPPQVAAIQKAATKKSRQRRRVRDGDGDA